MQAVAKDEKGDGLRVMVEMQHACDGVPVDWVDIAVPREQAERLGLDDPQRTFVVVSTDGAECRVVPRYWVGNQALRVGVLASFGGHVVRGYIAERPAL